MTTKGFFIATDTNDIYYSNSGAYITDGLGEAIIVAFLEEAYDLVNIVSDTLGLSIVPTYIEDTDEVLEFVYDREDTAKPVDNFYPEYVYEYVKNKDELNFFYDGFKFITIRKASSVQVITYGNNEFKAMADEVKSICEGLAG